MNTLKFSIAILLLAGSTKFAEANGSANEMAPPLAAFPSLPQEGSPIRLAGNFLDQAMEKVNRTTEQIDQTAGQFGKVKQKIDGTQNQMPELLPPNTQVFAGISITGVVIPQTTVSSVSPQITGDDRHAAFAVYLSLANVVRPDGAQNDCQFYILDKFDSRNDQTLLDRQQEYNKLSGVLVQLDNVRTTPNKTQCLFSQLNLVTKDTFVTEVTGVATSASLSAEGPSVLKFGAPTSVSTPVVSRFFQLRDTQASKSGWNICSSFYSQAIPRKKGWQSETHHLASLTGKRVRLTQVTRTKLSGFCFFESYEAVDGTSPSPQSLVVNQGATKNPGIQHAASKNHTAKLTGNGHFYLLLDTNAVFDKRSCRYYSNSSFTPSDWKRVKSLAGKRVLLKNVELVDFRGSCKFDHLQVVEAGK